MTNRDKISRFLSIALIIMFSYSFTISTFSDCFQEFRQCNAQAEEIFNNSQYTELDQDQYVQAIKNCLSSYDYCIDPPQQ